MSQARRNRVRRLQTGLRDGAGGSTNPRNIPGLLIWLRSDSGITTAMSAVAATGTTPPAVTLTGTIAAGQKQTATTTPYIEIDCTTGGTGAAASGTFKVNGVSVLTSQAFNATVVIPNTGLTANFPNSAYTNNNIYKANINASGWKDLISGVNFTQGTSALQPIYLGSDSNYNNYPSLNFVGANSQVLIGTIGATIAQPMSEVIFGNMASNGSQQGFFADAGGQTGIFKRTTNFYNLFGGTFVATTNNSTTPNAFGGIFNGASSVLYIGSTGTNLAVGNAGAAGINNTTVGVGGSGVPTNYITGAIAEIMVFNSALAISNFSKMFNYGAARYSPGSWA